MWLNNGLGSTPYALNLRVNRTNAAFPSTGTAWNNFGFGSSGMSYLPFLRVTAVGT
jgi:hypothetical protein